MDKYYEPELEEFHYGFEYECKFIEKHKGEIWLKSECGIDFSLGHIGDRDENKIYSISKESIRVKYLDKEDIESLGWELNNNIYFKNNYIIIINDKNNLNIAICKKEKDLISIRNSDIIVKNMTIKNKSELKKLLKQLQIG